MQFANRWILARGSLRSLRPLLVLVFSTLATHVLADGYAPQIGMRHVDFTLPAIDDGRPVSLEQFRGKKVLLIQFASW